MALCSVSFGFGKPINSFDSSAGVSAVEPVPDAAANPAECAAFCNNNIDIVRKVDCDPDLIDFFQIEMEQCIDECINK